MNKKQTQKSTRARQRRKKKQKAILRLAVLVLLAGVFVFSLVKLTGIVVTYAKNRRAYKDIREVSAVEATPVPPEAVPEETVPDEALPTFTPAPTHEPLPFYPDWEQLKTVCPDIVGWLYLEGTNIHYPVVQCSNNEFYLNHNARQEENSGGALFLDTYCDADSMNLVIYGHRM